MPHVNWFWLPDLVFHGIEATLYLILAILSASWVARSQTRIHLQWLIPFVINDALIFAQCVAWDGSSLLRIHWNAQESALYHTTGYMAGVAGVYGMFMLWQTLRAVLPARRQATASVFAEADAWPPPPSGNGPG